MATAITTPRINNNDDSVRFSNIISTPGTLVRKGDPIAEIETDKAVFTVEAAEDGYLLGFVPPLGEMIPVGGILAWVGSSPDDPIPLERNNHTAAGISGEPTLKAAVLLARFGLSAATVPARGERLTAEEVLEFVRDNNIGVGPRNGSVLQQETSSPLTPGESIALGVPERAMLKQTLWHRDSAVPGYVEIQYDTETWDAYAKVFQAEHRMLLSPLLPLMAWRLARLAMERPLLNCTITGDRRYQYKAVNIGFTLQADTRLVLLCVKDAGALSAKEFVDRLTTLMRRGMSGRLAPEETSGVTISFSSMSRWQVMRHIPVLPPYTSLIVAHAQSNDGVAALGGTYDHRVLTGGEVASVLRLLATSHP
jgi:pyruvate/2-oxoglutarate dehydrogenase complex dihydrolipoamide acyltransferase (E2) component